MPGFIGFPELLLLGLVVLLVFGPKRLPEMGRSMGRGLREFKTSITGDKDELNVSSFEVPAELVHDEEPIALVQHEEPVAVPIRSTRHTAA